MKMTNLFLYSGVLFLGLTVGSLSTIYYFSHSGGHSEKNALRSYPSNANGSNSSQNLNDEATATGPALANVNKDNKDATLPLQATVVDHGHYLQLLDALIEIANADTQTLYSIAERQLESVASQVENRVLSKALFQRWAHVDIAAALNWVEEELIPLLSGNANHPRLDDAIHGLSKINPAQTALWLDSLTGQQASAVRAITLPIFAREGIEQTLEKAKSSEKPWLSAQYAAELAKTEPLKAFEWSMALADKTSRDAALSEILWRWAESDIQGLSAHINNVTDPELQVQLYSKVGGQIVDSLSTDDPHAAMMWVDLQPENVQHKLRQTAFNRWVETQPGLAIEWLRGQSNSAEAQSLRSMAIPYVVEQDLDFALSLFDTLEPTQQIEMAQRIVNELSYQRPGELESWVASVADPNVRIKAESAISDISLLSRSESLIEELNYKTGAERAEHLHTIARVLSTGDPDRYSQWLHSDALSEEDHWILSGNASKGKCG